jgi:hypothetical protein
VSSNTVGTTYPWLRGIYEKLRSNKSRPKAAFSEVMQRGDYAALNAVWFLR